MKYCFVSFSYKFFCCGTSICAFGLVVVWTYLRLFLRSGYKSPRNYFLIPERVLYLHPISRSISIAENVL